MLQGTLALKYFQERARSIVNRSMREPESMKEQGSVCERAAVSVQKPESEPEKHEGRTEAPVCSNPRHLESAVSFDYLTLKPFTLLSSSVYLFWGTTHLGTLDFLPCLLLIRNCYPIFPSLCLTYFIFLIEKMLSNFIDI